MGDFPTFSHFVPGLSQSLQDQADAIAAKTTDIATVTAMVNTKASTASMQTRMLKANNLSDVADVPTARNNLGLNSAALSPVSAFATAAQGLLAETALQSVDLSDYATIENVAVVTTYVDTEIGLLSDEIDAELELKANVSDMQSQFNALQESYDTLNNNFLCLLKWSIITFGQVPEGLESYIEPALNTE